MIRYHESMFDLPAVRIVAGESFVTGRDMVIVTLLGSCVAACIRDPVSGLIGMNHFMLPTDSGLRSKSNGNYGIPAMNRLIGAVLERGANPATLEAKVFGGGVVTGERAFLDVGKMNAEFVVEYLKGKGIAVLAADLRGLQSRKVYFVQRTGRVHVHHLRRDDVSQCS
jgi:chemotaxis protein CheD